MRVVRDDDEPPSSLAITSDLPSWIHMSVTSLVDGQFGPYSRIEWQFCTYRVDAGNRTRGVAKRNTDGKSLPGFNGDTVRTVAHFEGGERSRGDLESESRGESRGCLRPKGTKKIFLDCLMPLWLVLIDSRWRCISSSSYTCTVRYYHGIFH